MTSLSQEQRKQRKMRDQPKTRGKRNEKQKQQQYWWIGRLSVVVRRGRRQNNNSEASAAAHDVHSGLAIVVVRYEPHVLLQDFGWMMPASIRGTYFV